ncbi:MAG: hypothetical protein AAF571_04545 [Verrucomicrobiota bacterium]
MKALLSSLVIVITAAVAVTNTAEAQKVYGDTTLKSILMDASEFKNDRVSYTAPYGGFTTNAPLFIDRNGFKEGKHVVINAGGTQFLIIAEKDDVESTLLDLKRGSIIKVSGKVREMKNDPKRGINTGHYLELEGLEVVREPARTVAKKKVAQKKKANLATN